MCYASQWLDATFPRSPNDAAHTIGGGLRAAHSASGRRLGMAHDWTALSERSRNDPPFLTRRGDAQLLSAAPPAPHAHQVHPHARTAQRRDQAADPRRADLSGGTLLRFPKFRLRPTPGSLSYPTNKSDNLSFLVQIRREANRPNLPVLVQEGVVQKVPKPQAP